MNTAASQVSESRHHVCDHHPSHLFDNIRFDDEGRLWVAACDDGVHCYTPDGTLIGRLLVPETAANITFGGPKNNRMFITATTSLFSLMMSVTGAPRIGSGR